MFLESCIITLTMLAPALVQAAPFDVAALMRDLAQAKPGEVRFVESKYSELLTAPLQTSGTMRYTPPDRLEKHTLLPRIEHMVVAGDTLTMTRGERTRSMALSEYPVLRAFIDSIRGTLAGDRVALERFYRLRLEGDAARWMLTLEPLENDMRALVQSIRITGAKSGVREIEVFESRGDRSVLTIVEGG